MKGKKIMICSFINQFFSLVFWFSFKPFAALELCTKSKSLVDYFFVVAMLLGDKSYTAGEPVVSP